MSQSALEFENAHQELQRLCDSMAVDMDTVKNVWDSICLANQIQDENPSTPNHFELIRSELKSRNEKFSRVRVKRTAQVRGVSTPKKPVLFKGNENLSVMHANPLQEKNFNTPTSNRVSDSKSTPKTPSFKNLVSTPSKKPSPFLSRVNRLSLVSSFNEHIPFITASERRPEVSLLHNVMPYRYGYNRLDADQLNERIEFFEKVFEEQSPASKNKIADENIETIEEDQKMKIDDRDHHSSVFVGMICSDSLESNRLNPKSIILQTSRHQNMRLRLNMDKLDSFGVFPGQIVKVTGTQVGDTVFCNRLETPNMLPFAVTSVGDLSKSGLGPLDYIIASGPYTLNDSSMFEPLGELVDYIISKRPNLVVLMGPFISEEHPLIQTGKVEMSVSEMFSELVAPKINKITESSPNCRVILIPSVSDILSDTPCLPQPPLTDNRCTKLGLNADILCFSNPVQFKVNHIVFASISYDTVLSISSVETTQNMSQDRMSRLVHQVLSQRNFTPVFPLPFKSFDSAMDLKVTPDVLILPSMIKPFVKTIEQCVVVNPGTTCKAASSGTFVHGILHPLDQEELSKLDEDHELLGLVDQRMRIDIMKL